MAYRPPKTKPEPNQADITDGDYKYAPSGEAVFEALRLKLPKPSIDGENGQLLARGLNADTLSWVNPPGSLPSGALEHQVLVYDGAAATWAYPGLGDGTLGTGNVILGQGKPAGLTGTLNVLIGEDAGTAVGSNSGNVLIGWRAGSDVAGTDNIAIGFFTLSNNFIPSPSDNTIAIGRQAGGAIDSGFPRSTQVKSVLLGSFANYLNYSDSSIVIGHEANRTTTGERINTTGCIVLGREAYSDGLSNIFTAGSSNYPINVAYFGKGAKAITGANLTNFTLTVGRALGENQSAATGTLTLAGSQGTGTGSGGAVIISTAPASLSSGTSLNAHVERVRVTTDGKVGIGTASPSMKLEVDAGSSNDILKLVSNAYSYSLSRDNSNGNLKFTGSQTGFVGYTFSSPEGDRLTIAGSGNVTIAENLTVNKQSTLTGITGIGTSPISNVALVVSGATDGNQLQILQNAGYGYKIGRESSEGYLVLDGTQTSFCGYIFKEDGAEVFKINRNKNVQVVAGDLSIDTVGKGLAIKAGNNAKIGTAQFTAQQTVTVNTTAITANSLVFLTGQDGVNSYAVQNKVASTGPGTGSFEIHHIGGNTTSLVAWMIVEATP